jgi:hypothetical protein
LTGCAILQSEVVYLPPGSFDLNRGRLEIGD